MVFAKRLSAVALAATLGATAAAADEESRLAVAIGTPGSESFTFGTGLWAMGQIALLPDHGIVLDQREVTADEDRLSLLRGRDVEAALVYGRVPNAYGDDVRAIMALWPGGVSSDEADPVQFLVHRDVADDVVYQITRAMFEHANYFESAHASLGVGQPSEAMKGLDIPLHAGAFRYYDENGFGLEQAVAANYWGKKHAASSYRDFDDEKLDANEIEQIAAACRHALEIGSLSLVLGDLDNTGCEVYQDRLIDAKAARNEPAANNPRAFATSVQPGADGAGDAVDGPVGQGGPAIRWTPAAEGTGAVESVTPARRAHQPIM